MSESYSFGSFIPAEGTLNPVATTTYGPRDRDHVIPWNTIGPGPGEVWQLDAFFVTSLVLDGQVAYFTVAVAPNDLLRSALTVASPSSLGGQPVIKYGNALQPVAHYGWGHPLEAGKSDGFECGGRILRGDSAAGAIKGQSIWLGAWPGSNVNPLGAGNDGVLPGISIDLHGERLA